MKLYLRGGMILLSLAMLLPGPAIPVRASLEASSEAETRQDNDLVEFIPTRKTTEDDDLVDMVVTVIDGERVEVAVQSDPAAPSVSRSSQGEIQTEASSQTTSEEAPAADGMLSAPDHPVRTPIERKIFIGDSRTVAIMEAVQDDSIWACMNSMGYQWMVSDAVPAIEEYIEDNTAVIILMGVNDVYNLNNYIAYVNQKAAEWAALGAKTYYVSVGPVDGDPYVTNSEIEYFNATLQSSLSGVTYIDLYTHMMENGFWTLDGTHYPDEISIDIYNFVVEHLEDNRVGLW